MITIDDANQFIGVVETMLRAKLEYKQRNDIIKLGIEKGLVEAEYRRVLEIAGRVIDQQDRFIPEIIEMSRLVVLMVKKLDKIGSK